MNKNSYSWMVVLEAETSIHAGAGDGAGLVDLPIMRESQNAWPCVFGSAMKGALRAKSVPANQVKDEYEPLLDATFGKEGNEGAGRLLVGDARILALPMRSLNVPSVNVTCPAVLTRFIQDAKRLGLLDLHFSLPDEIAQINHADNENTCLLDETLISGVGETTKLYLEEHYFTTQHWNNSNVQALKEVLPQLSKLVIVRDDIFSHFCSLAVPIRPHIRIDDETGTVAQGALWYEESLPPQTLLYWPLSLSPVGRSGLDDSEVAPYVEQVVLGLETAKQSDSASGVSASAQIPALAPYIQIGGNETVGMGWCKMALLFNQQGA